MVTRKAFLHIIDIRLPDEEEHVIHEVPLSFSRDVVEYHKLRTRMVGTERHIDMHIVVPKNQTFETAHSLADMITAGIRDRLSGSYVLVHIEPCDGAVLSVNRLSARAAHNTASPV